MAIFNRYVKLPEGYQKAAKYISQGSKGSVLGSSDEVCCDKTCAVHECQKGTLRPSPSMEGGVSDEQCCESKLCPELRKLKESPTGHCNGFSQEECEGYYTILRTAKEMKSKNETVKPDTDVFAKCVYDKEFDLCRMKDTLTATDCSPM